MSNDAKFKETLRQCRICDDGLISAIDERVDGGESLLSICNDYEDFQRQVHGEIFYTSNAIRQRYRYHKGQKQVGQNDQSPAQEAIKLIYKAYRAKERGTRDAYFAQAKALKVPTGDLKVELEEEARKVAPLYRMIAAAIDFFGVGDYDILYREMNETLDKIKEIQNGKAPQG